MFCYTNVTYVTLTHLKKTQKLAFGNSEILVLLYVTTSVKYKMSLGSGIKTKILESKQTYKSKKIGHWVCEPGYNLYLYITRYRQSVVVQWHR